MTSPATDLKQTMRLQAMSIGPMAQRALAGTTVQPFARFERCAYVATTDGQIACIGDTTIGNGPLNAILVPRGVATLTTDRREEACYEINLTGASLWQPNPATPHQTTAARATLRALLDASRTFDLAEGLSPLLAPLLEHRIPEIDSNALLARAWPGIASLRDWLGCRGDDCGPLPSETVALIGLGPGLTPSGDDVLAGCLIALHQTSRHRQAAELAGHVVSIAGNATGRISAAHLGCAAEGYGSAALHQTLDALLTGSLQNLPDCLTALDRVGHSSGWDGLIGVVLGLTAAQ